MKFVMRYIVLMSIGVLCLVRLSYCSKQHSIKEKMFTKAFDTQDIVSLFALTPEKINTDVYCFMDEAKQQIDQIIALPDNERTFSNTAKALDEIMALSNLAIAQRVYEALELLSPDDLVRNAAHDAFIKIQNFWNDNISSNKKLYNAFMEYAQATENTQHLTDAQHYFINDTINTFKREGLALSDEVLSQVNNIRKELAELSADFDRNIAQDSSSVKVKKDGLAGLSEDFIAELRRDGDDYIVGVDYPTYFRVMEFCSVQSTRKSLYIAFQNRAYPANDELIRKIIEKRDELAHLLGYDFAHYDLADQMAHSPEKAKSFIIEMIKKSEPKVKKEIDVLMAELPESVVLSPNGKLQPWDFSYIESSYKKKHYNIDEEKIAEYFPMEKTIKELLDIYRQFFGIEFQECTAEGLWHEDVTIVRVLGDEGNLLGTLLLDLYPRPNKYSHAAHTTIIPGTILENGTRVPDVSIVIANFAKPTADKPSLLNRSEVKTFFHEFGHALHAILGVTPIASLSGTQTKTDFVELPSQMLEEWLDDKDILRKVSGHYLTGEPLPDDVIDTLISLKNLTSGYFVVRQGFLSMLALSYFGEGANKDPYMIMKDLYTETMDFLEFCPEYHFYASFGHLTGYAAKYYGYLWSRVYAEDVFSEIKKYGLLNPEIGKKYIKEVLEKGGSQDPNELLYNFLGREPNANAFLSSIGLK